MNDTDHDLLIAINERTKATDTKVDAIVRRLDNDYVLKTEFEPVKRIVFGVAWIVLAGVVVALLAVIIRKGV